MSHVRFLIYQFIFCNTFFIINFYLDKYISKPFTRVDLIATCINILIVTLLVILSNKLYKPFKSIRLRNKILLSIPAVILAILFIGLLENIWFEIKGELLFN